MQKVVSILLILLMFYTFTAFSINANAAVSSQPLEIRSESAVLIDAVSGQILYQKNMNKKMYPASITKIMTGMLALEKGDLSQVITMSYDAVFSIDRNSAHIALDADEEITLEQALYALSIASANEAANGIAESIGGSVENFVEMMNKAAIEAGAENTNFTNAHGLPDDNHYTTAYDMAKIASYALKIPKFIEIFGEERYDIPPTNKQSETRMLWNRNNFLNGGIPYEGILMSKAGWTSDAQHTLVTAAKRGDTTLVAVVMKSANSNDKWEDTTALFDYGFNVFTPVKISKERLEKSAPTEIVAGDNSKISTTFTAPSDVSILIPSGKTIDNVSITYGDPEIDERKNQAQITVCISLDDSYITGSPTELVDVDINMNAQIELLESGWTAFNSSVQKNTSSETNSMMSLFFRFILIGAIVLFFIRRWNITMRRIHRKRLLHRRQSNKY